MDIASLISEDADLYLRMADAIHDPGTADSQVFYRKVQEFVGELLGASAEVEYLEDQAWLMAAVRGWQTHLRSMGVKVPVAKLPAVQGLKARGSHELETNGIPDSPLIDHTVVPVTDKKKTAEFLSLTLGLENVGAVGPYLVIRVNPYSVINLEESTPFQAVHYAIAMGPEEFDAAFSNLKDCGISYGDGPKCSDNMQGPGRTLGARGDGRAIYFRDPDNNLLEIRCYSETNI